MGIYSINKIQNFSPFYEDLNLKVINYWNYPNPSEYPQLYIYYGTDGNLWVSYGFSTNATIAKINPSNLQQLATIVIDTGGSSWGWTNKTDNNIYLFSGSPSWNVCKINLSDLSWQKFNGSLNTPHGCRLVGNQLWIGTWYTIYVFDPNTLSQLFTVGVGATNGFLSDGSYVYALSTDWNYIYKINLSGSIVATLNIGKSGKEVVQDTCHLLKNGFIYTVRNDDYLYKIDITNMSIVNSWYIQGLYGMATLGNYLYISTNRSSNSCILKYDISNNQFNYISQKNYGFNLYSIRTDGNYFYIVCDKDSNGNKRIIKTPVF
jgi:hypothetical protein